MLVILLVFALLPLFVRSLTRWIGRQVFPFIALLPAAAFVHALTVTPQVFDGGAREELEWIPQLGVDFSLVMDPLAWVMTLIVTGIGALVIFYCAYYFNADEEALGRFAAVLLAFAGAMYGLVL